MFQFKNYFLILSCTLSLELNKSLLWFLSNWSETVVDLRQLLYVCHMYTSPFLPVGVDVFCICYIYYFNSSFDTFKCSSRSRTAWISVTINCVALLNTNVLILIILPNDQCCTFRSHLKGCHTGVVPINETAI